MSSLSLSLSFTPLAYCFVLLYLYRIFLLHRSLLSFFELDYWINVLGHTVVLENVKHDFDRDDLDQGFVEYNLFWFERLKCTNVTSDSVLCQSCHKIEEIYNQIISYIFVHYFFFILKFCPIRNWMNQKFYYILIYRDFEWYWWQPCWVTSFHSHPHPGQAATYTHTHGSVRLLAAGPRCRHKIPDISLKRKQKACTTMQ